MCTKDKGQISLTKYRGQTAHVLRSTHLDLPTWTCKHINLLAGMAKRHFEALSHREGGGVALVSSSLTGREWAGAVWVFSDYSDYLSSCNLDLIVTRTTTGISDVLWLANQKDLVLACDSGELEVWRCERPGHTLSAIASLGCHDDMVLVVRQLAEEHLLVSGGGDGKVIVWDVEATKMVKSYRGHYGQTLSVSAHPTSSACFLSTGQDSVTLLWDTRQLKPASKLSASRSVVYTSSAWEMENLALGCESGCVEVYDVRGDPVPFARYSPHIRSVQRLTFAPWNSSLLASVSDDCTVAVKVLSEDNAMMVCQDHRDFVRGASWNTSDQTLLSCGWDGQIIKHSLTQLANCVPLEIPSTEIPAAIVGGRLAKLGDELAAESPANQVPMSCDDHTKSCDQTATQLTTREEPLDMFADTNKIE